jgi:membrane-associated PAP2 superfamily phosphatase
MDRTGLLIALAIAVAGGLLFGLFPELDLTIAALFYDPAKKDFMLRWTSPLTELRDAAMWVVAILIAPACIALALKIVFPWRKMMISGSAVVFLITTLALAPGIVTNVILKDYWGRSRPIDVPQFNGEERFTPWWDPRGPCPKNCSFVAGEGSGAFWTIAPAALAPPAWRPLAYGAALAFGIAVSALRVTFGAHFVSDALFGGVFTFLVIWLVHGLIYRWPRTRLADDAIERKIEDSVLPVYDHLAKRFRRRPG